MANTLNKKELGKILEDVTNDFGKLLAKAEEMEKADPGEETPGEKTPESSSAAPAKDASPEASESAPAEAPAPHAEPDGDETPAAPAAPAADAQAADPATAQAQPEQTLEGEYGKLPVEELKLHFIACKTALIAALGAAGGSPDAPPPAATPPAPAPAPVASAPAPTPPAPDMGKKEFPASEGSGGDVSVGKMAKSDLETRFETLEKALKESQAYGKTLETKFGEVADGLKTLLSKPLRKSIANISYVPRDESEVASADKPKLSKAEAIQKCNGMDLKELKKSDRDLLVSFVTGNCPQEKIEHLLSK